MTDRIVIGANGRKYITREPAPRERLAQPEQEPVAWMVYTQDGQSVYVTDNPIDIQERQRVLPLYPTPPQRPWVGLTKEEAKEISLANRPYVIDMIAALEARLKEKNT